MRHASAVVALAFLLVLSGCNAVLGADAGTPEGTVTPAPVPTVEKTRTTDTGCAVPPPRTPDAGGAGQAATKPTAVRPLGLTNGTVDGERLVEAHAMALRNYSYTLRAGDDVRVRALANASAFTYTGIRGIRYYRAYAVGGTLYTLEPDAEGQYHVRRQRYRPGSVPNRRFAVSLVARDWLADRMRWFDYRLVETLTLNETRLRVFRAAFDHPIPLRQRVIVDVESTVFVDRRGIIRKVDHRQQLRVGPADDGVTQWQNDTFAVTDVGTTRIRRPEAFCSLDPEPPGTD